MTIKELEEILLIYSPTLSKYEDLNSIQERILVILINKHLTRLEIVEKLHCQNTPSFRSYLEDLVEKGCLVKDNIRRPYIYRLTNG